MKKLVRMSAAALTLMMAAHTAHAQSGMCGSNCTWNLNASSGVLTISGSGSMTDWSAAADVPWYSYKASIRSVVISGVTNIGGYAFYGYTALTQVTIGNSVISIGRLVFRNCRGLTQVTIPNSVTSIDRDAFGNCSGLTQVTIPNSVISIGGSAFAGCTSLTQVTIPNSVTSMGDHAFYLTGLTQVTIPNSVTFIDNGVFEACRGLTQVTIPNSVTLIYGNAFSSCTALTQVTIPNSVTRMAQSFTGCTALTQVTIGNSVTEIGYSTFANCTALTQVTIPKSVTKIDDYAFQNCTTLTKITALNPTPITINDNVFFNVNRNIPLYVPSGALSVYRSTAVWSTFTNIIAAPDVTFNSQGGSVVATQPVAPNTKAVQPADPSKNGYTFCGWYRETNCVNEWNFNTAVTGNITLFAKWLPNTITVTYKCEGVGCNPDFGVKQVTVQRNP